MCESVPPLTPARGERRAQRRQEHGRAPGRSSWTASTRFYAKLPDGAAPPLRSRLRSSACPSCDAPRARAARLLGGRPPQRWRSSSRGTNRGPEDIRRVIDSYGYLDDWRANYRIQSVRSSLQQPAHHVHRRRHPVVWPARAALPEDEAARSSPSTGAIRRRTRSAATASRSTGARTGASGRSRSRASWASGIATPSFADETGHRHELRRRPTSTWVSSRSTSG